MFRHPFGAHAALRRSRPIFPAGLARCEVALQDSLLHEVSAGGRARPRVVAERPEAGRGRRRVPPYVHAGVAFLVGSELVDPRGNARPRSLARWPKTRSSRVGLAAALVDSGGRTCELPRTECRTRPRHFLGRSGVRAASAALTPEPPSRRSPRGSLVAFVGAGPPKLFGKLRVWRSRRSEIRVAVQPVPDMKDLLLDQGSPRSREELLSSSCKLRLACFIIGF